VLPSVQDYFGGIGFLLLLQLVLEGAYLALEAGAAVQGVHFLLIGGDHSRLEVADLCLLLPLELVSLVLLRQIGRGGS
jgi:hypothetical protein